MVSAYMELTNTNTTINTTKATEIIIHWFNIITSRKIRVTANKKKSILTTLKDWRLKEILNAIRNMNNDKWSIENNQINLDRLISGNKRDKNMEKWSESPYEPMTKSSNINNLSEQDLRAEQIQEGMYE